MLHREDLRSGSLSLKMRVVEEVRMQNPLVGGRVAGDRDGPAEAVVAAAYRCLQATGRHALRGIECEFEDDALIL